MKKLLCLLPAVIGAVAVVAMPILTARVARGMTLSSQVDVVAMAFLAALIVFSVAVFITVSLLDR